MTTTLEKVIEEMKDVERFGKLSDDSKDSRSKIKDDARKESRQYVFDQASSEIEGFDVPNPDELEEGFVNNWLAYEQARSKEKASDRLSKNHKTILNQVKPETLDKLVRVKEVADELPEDDEEVTRRYQSYLTLTDLIDKYGKGESISDDQEKAIIGVAAREAGDAQADKLKKAKYSTDLQNIGRTLHSKAVQLGYVKKDQVKDYASKGLKTVKKEYKEFAKTKGKDARDSTRKALTSLIEGSREQFDTALSLIYQAETEKLKAA